MEQLIKIHICSGNGNNYFSSFSTSIQHFLSSTYRIPTNPEIKQKWIDAIREANNGPYSGTGYVCNLHFSEGEIVLKYGQFHLVQGAVPTEFWVDCTGTFDEDIDVEVQGNDEYWRRKHNELKENILKNKTGFEIREISLKEKNQRLNDIIKKQSTEISILKKSLTASQDFVEKLKLENIQLKSRLLDATTSSNVPVSLSCAHKLHKRTGFLFICLA